MTNPITVYAVPGRRIRDPQTGSVVGPDGLSVPSNSLWQRLLRDGDVTTTKPRAKADKGDK